MDLTHAFSILIAIVVLGIFSILFFLIFRNKQNYEQVILRQRAAESALEVSENYMNALPSQMNSHFIFNCVDTVERLLRDLKIEEAKICLVKFSNLIRTVLENSKKREISLAEEIEVLRLYMDIENLRFEDPFCYDVDIEPDIDATTTLIAPLILQPFVENSIKHGFLNSVKSGHLTIKIWKENEFLVCAVVDNGVGRIVNSSVTSISGFKKASLGIKITEERLKLINITKKVQTKFSIDDLKDSIGKPAGTRVNIFLPYELSV